LWVDQMSLTFGAAHRIISSTNVSDPPGQPHEVKLFPLASVNPTTVFSLKDIPRSAILCTSINQTNAPLRLENLAKSMYARLAA
jgi:hypothetical protein